MKTLGPLEIVREYSLNAAQERMKVYTPDILFMNLLLTYNNINGYKDSISKCLEMIDRLHKFRPPVETIVYSSALDLHLDEALLDGPAYIFKPVSYPEVLARRIRNVYLLYELENKFAQMRH